MNVMNLYINKTKMKFNKGMIFYFKSIFIELKQCTFDKLDFSLIIDVLFQSNSMYKIF